MTTKITIGVAHSRAHRPVPRTLREAFGPYAQLTTEEVGNRADRFIGRLCAAVLLGYLLGAAWQWVA
jgi:hypothetical protein